MKLLTVHYKYVESSDQSVDYELTMHTLNDLIAPPVMTPLEICLPTVEEFPAVWHRSRVLAIRRSARTT
jgi:hypothetical protein